MNMRKRKRKNKILKTYQKNMYIKLDVERGTLTENILIK
jgi:hypothetical protein